MSNANEDPSGGPKPPSGPIPDPILPPPVPEPSFATARVAELTAFAGIEGPACGGRTAARWLLLLAVLLGATRFFRLGAWGLWIDEALTLNDVGQWLSGEGALFRGNALGIAVIAGWVHSLGHWPSEADLRWLPAVAGFLGIPLTYWAFWPVAGRRRAAAAALLVAASSWHLYWSQNARFYTFAQDLGLLSSGCLLRAFARDKPRLAILAVCFGGLAALAHLSGALILASALCASWIVARPTLGQADSLRRSRRVLTIAALVAGLVALPWVWNLWQEYIAAQRAKTGSGQLRAMAHMILTTGYYVSPTLAAGALAGALIGRRRSFDHFAILICLIVAAAVLVAATRARVTAQYVFVLLPWIAILAARPLDAVFGKRAPALAWIVLVLLCAPGLARQALYFTAHQGARPRWKEAYEYVWRVREPSDLVLGMNTPVGEYYLSPGDTNTRVPKRITRLTSFTPEPALEWARYGKRMWIVVSQEWFEDWALEDRRRMRAFLIERCHLANHFPLDVETRDLSVWVYRYDPE